MASFYGADSYNSSNPIGGGEGYSAVVVDGEYHVTSAAELIAALLKVEYGQTIFVESGAIDLTGHIEISIPEGVTLASNRGAGQAAGALIFTTKQRHGSLFVAGARSRVTGLRLQGPYEGTSRNGSLVRGIAGTDMEVDNCECFGWGHGAIDAYGNTYIHNCHIHHNQVNGYGYGVICRPGMTVVEACLFNYNRHSIASPGEPECGYEARYNIVGENAIGHGFDVHGGQARRDGTDVAGKLIHIHHNTFHLTKLPAIVIRGVPTEGADIHHNWFFDENMNNAVKQKTAVGNMTVYDNAVSLQCAPAEWDGRFSSERPQPPQNRIIRVDYDPFQLILCQPTGTVHGTVWVDLWVRLHDKLQLSQVEIWSDVQRIFSGEIPPGYGELIIDTTKMTNGDHIIHVVAQADSGEGCSHDFVYIVEN